MFARCGFAVHAFWIFAGWNGLEEALFFGKKFGEEWSQSLTLVCRVSFFFFFFLKRLERIVSFLFSSSFVLWLVRINMEFVKLAVEHGIVSLEINLFVIRGLFWYRINL